MTTPMTITEIIDRIVLDGLDDLARDDDDLSASLILKEMGQRIAKAMLEREFLTAAHADAVASTPERPHEPMRMRVVAVPNGSALGGREPLCILLDRCTFDPETLQKQTRQIEGLTLPVLVFAEEVELS